MFLKEHHHDLVFTVHGKSFDQSEQGVRSTGGELSNACSGLFVRGGSRGGSLGSNEPPFFRLVRLTSQPVLVPQAIFSEQFILTRMQRNNFSRVELRVALIAGFWKCGRGPFNYFARLLRAAVNEPPFLNC